MEIHARLDISSHISWPWINSPVSPLRTSTWSSLAPPPLLWTGSSWSWTCTPPWLGTLPRLSPTSSSPWSWSWSWSSSKSWSPTLSSSSLWWSIWMMHSDCFDGSSGSQLKALDWIAWQLWVKYQARSTQGYEEDKLNHLFLSMMRIAP